MTRRILIATVAALVGGLFIANTAGAAFTPWWCHVNPGVSAACKVVETGQAIDRKANAAADAAGTTYQTGEQVGRVGVSSVELGGTLAGKLADGLAWANTQAAQLPVPSRTLQLGECVTTTSGRYCPPERSTPTAEPAASAVPVGTCVVDSAGRKWCVTRSSCSCSSVACGSCTADRRAPTPSPGTG